jgi:peptidoglycan/LPS O-acetylase OafA/YrhL
VGTVAITCALAAMIFRFIEKPGIAIGKRVTRLSERQA